MTQRREGLTEQDTEPVRVHPRGIGKSQLPNSRAEAGARTTRTVNELSWKQDAELGGSPNQFLPVFFPRHQSRGLSYATTAMPNLSTERTRDRATSLLSQPSLTPPPASPPRWDNDSPTEIPDPTHLALSP